MGGRRRVRTFQSPSLLLLGFLAVAMAGCVGGDGAAKDVNAPVAATFDETTGGVEGVVLDDEGLPIGGAQVGILALSLSTIADPGGHFSLSHVEPGEHELAVSGLGFAPTVERIAVTAGQKLELQITLQPVAIQETYHLVQGQRGLFGCGTSWRPAAPVVGLSGIAICGVIGIAGDVTGLDTTAYDEFLLNWTLLNSTEAGWRASVFEMKWDSNQAAGKGLTMIWEVADCYNVRDARFGYILGRTPLRGNVSAERINQIIANGKLEPNAACDSGETNPDDTHERNCNPEFCYIHSRVFSSPDTLGASSGADVGFTWQQPFEQFHTAFYHGDSAPDYTALK